MSDLEFENQALAFLQKKIDRWPRLPATELSGLTDEWRESVINFEEAAIETEPIQIRDVLLRMRHPPHFAIQYSLFNKDYRNTLANMRAQCSPHPPEVRRAMERVFCLLMEYKLAILEEWYFIIGGLTTAEYASNERSKIIEQHARNAQQGCAGKSAALVLLAVAGLYLSNSLLSSLLAR